MKAPVISVLDSNNGLGLLEGTKRSKLTCLEGPMLDSRAPLMKQHSEKPGLQSVTLNRLSESVPSKSVYRPH